MSEPIDLPSSSPEVGVQLQGHVATVELRNPPHNYFTIGLVRALADAFEDLEADARCRAIVLAAQGSAFCAGADFSSRDAAPPQRSPRGVNPIYAEALRLFACTKPSVAAVHGAAVGGGLGVALVTDFRVGCAEARFSANFNRLGIHPGFGLSVTLPRLIGAQQSALLFYTGRRIGGQEALALGLVDQLVPQDQVRAAALALAQEIAGSAPLAVQSTRATVRQGLVEQIRLAVAHESTEQNRQFNTADFQEGVAAMATRRAPQFKGA